MSALGAYWPLISTTHMCTLFCAAQGEFRVVSCDPAWVSQKQRSNLPVVLCCCVQERLNLSILLFLFQEPAQSICVKETPTRRRRPRDGTSVSMFPFLSPCITLAPIISVTLVPVVPSRRCTSPPIFAQACLVESRPSNPISFIPFAGVFLLSGQAAAPLSSFVAARLCSILASSSSPSFPSCPSFK